MSLSPSSSTTAPITLLDHAARRIRAVLDASARGAALLTPIAARFALAVGEFFTCPGPPSQLTLITVAAGPLSIDFAIDRRLRRHR